MDVYVIFFALFAFFMYISYFLKSCHHMFVSGYGDCNILFFNTLIHNLAHIHLSLFIWYYFFLNVLFLSSPFACLVCYGFLLVSWL